MVFEGVDTLDRLLDACYSINIRINTLKKINKKSMTKQPEIIVSRVMLTGSKQMSISLKSDNDNFITQANYGEFSLKIPYLKRLFSGKKKVRYILPKGGVPIIAGPDVINRITAMARMKKVYTLSM